MEGKHILLMLGGEWHDFDGFMMTMQPVFEAAGYTIEASDNVNKLAQLVGSSYDVVLLYTCLGGVQRDGTTPSALTEAQVQGLVQWVRDGGGLLAAHAATLACQSRPALKSLMGGVFESHPPQFSFTVYPTSREHPITQGLFAFTVYDELYIQVYEDTVDIHMLAVDRGVAYPMVWSKNEGLGRVAHIALGHSRAVWTLAPYRRLMVQTIGWLTA